jgi:sugar lactone lactonase YvrE
VLLAFTAAESAFGATPIASQDFGQVLVSRTGSAQNLTFSFTGQIAPTFKFSYSGEFSFGTSNCTANSCSVPVTFSPHYPGLRQSAVIARDSTQRAIGVVFVHGIGLAPQTSVRPGVITTVAGDRGWGGAGDGGAATLASLSSPQGVAVDPAGNLFIADTTDQVVREVSGATITTVSGTRGVFDSPAGLALDALGDIYVADSGNNVVREINALTGAVTVFAGGGHPTSGLGDGGAAINAKLSGPSDVAVDAAGNVFIADTNNGLIRRVDTSGIISTVAGSGTSTIAPWGDGASALTATLSSPQGLTLDAGGNLYIADTGHNVIRYVLLSTGVISTVAGNGGGGYGGDNGLAVQAALQTPVGLCLDAAGDLYIADSGNSVIREVLAGSGSITTVAGDGTAGFTPDGGSPVSAELYSPRNVALDSAGNLFIVDTGNNIVRKVTSSLLGLSFGTVDVGLASPAENQTVFNIGNQPLDFSALNVTGSFRYDTSNTWDCSPSSIVLPGTGCVISAQFVPLTAATSAGSITFTTNSLNAAVSNQAGLNGLGIPGAVPQAQISPVSLTFSAQTVGTVSTPQTVAFKNTGSASLSNLSIWLSGSNVGAFQITGSNCASVAVGASCTVSVVFAPQAAGSFSAGIVFTDALANSPQSVVVSGVGTPQTTFLSLIIPQNTSIQIGAISADSFLAMQGDGNLVLYQNGAALWASGTGGQKCGASQCFAAFQGDGNFVIYNGSAPVWNSGTGGNPGAQLVLSSQSPHIQIIGRNQSILWADRL